MAGHADRLVWFLHFHKAGGSSVVRLAGLNGEVLHSPNANGNPVDADGKEPRPWELTPDGLRGYVERLRATGVSFVASEWGVPDLDTLTAIPGVQVVTMVRDPVARLRSGFYFDHRAGFSRARTFTDYVDHHIDLHTHCDYYVRHVLGPDWRTDLPPETAVAEAARRLRLVHHLAFLEDGDSHAALAASLGWQDFPVHAQRFRRDVLRRIRSGLRFVGKGRVDLARRAIAAPPTVSPEEIAWVRERCALDLDLLARLRTPPDVPAASSAGPDAAAVRG